MFKRFCLAVIIMACTIGAVVLILLLTAPSRAGARRPCPPVPDAWAAKVVRWVDGDTVKAPVPGHAKPRSLRLAWIDAPEKTQPFGPKATAYARELTGDSRCSFVLIGYDRYCRPLVAVWDANLHLVNYELARAGLAWPYKRDTTRTIKKLAAQAKAEGRGLWAQKHAEDPATHRRWRRLAPKLWPAP